MQHTPSYFFMIGRKQDKQRTENSATPWIIDSLATRVCLSWVGHPSHDLKTSTEEAPLFVSQSTILLPSLRVCWNITRHWDETNSTMLFTKGAIGWVIGIPIWKRWRARKESNSHTTNWNLLSLTKDNPLWITSSSTLVLDMKPQKLEKPWIQWPWRFRRIPPKPEMSGFPPKSYHLCSIWRNEDSGEPIWQTYSLCW